MTVRKRNKDDRSYSGNEKEDTLKAYKGFDQNLKCRDFQFEVGKEYEEKEADICSCGFHACENPLDVIGYYPPADSRYCEVDLDANEQKENDSKRVGKHIKISAEIGLPGLIKAGVEYIKYQVDWENAKATNTGNRSAATVEGKESVAISLGIEGKAKGAIGCFLVLAEWKQIDGKWHRTDVKSVAVDGENIKPDTFYILKDGIFTETE